MSSACHEARMRRFREAGLYLVTSAEVSRGRTTLFVVEQALKGGVRLVQLREKHLSTRALVELAVQVKARCDKAGALFLINDRLDVALAVDADGVHLGQDDLPAREARRLAPDMIIGVSTHGPEEAVKAEQDGASYINIGPLFPTRTKAWTDDFLGLQGLLDVSDAVGLPFSVMGGIRAAHIPDLVEAGAETVAVISAVTAAEDPAAAAERLRGAVLDARVIGRRDKA